MRSGSGEPASRLRRCLTRSRTCCRRTPWLTVLSSLVFVTGLLMWTINSAIGRNASAAALRVLGLEDPAVETLRPLIATTATIGFSLLIAQLALAIHRAMHPVHTTWRGDTNLRRPKLQLWGLGTGVFLAWSLVMLMGISLGALGIWSSYLNNLQQNAPPPDYLAAMREATIQQMEMLANATAPGANPITTPPKGPTVTPTPTPTTPKGTIAPKPATPAPVATHTPTAHTPTAHTPTPPAANPKPAAIPGTPTPTPATPAPSVPTPAPATPTLKPAATPTPTATPTPAAGTPVATPTPAPATPVATRTATPTPAAATPVATPAPTNATLTLAKPPTAAPGVPQPLDWNPTPASSRRLLKDPTPTPAAAADPKADPKATPATPPMDPAVSSDEMQARGIMPVPMVEGPNGTLLYVQFILTKQGIVNGTSDVQACPPSCWDVSQFYNGAPGSICMCDISMVADFHNDLIVARIAVVPAAVGAIITMVAASWALLFFYAHFKALKAKLLKYQALHETSNPAFGEASRGLLAGPRNFLSRTYSSVQDWARGRTSGRHNRPFSNLDHQASTDRTNGTHGPTTTHTNPLAAGAPEQNSSAYVVPVTNPLYETWEGASTDPAARQRAAAAAAKKNSAPVAESIFRPNAAATTSSAPISSIPRARGVSSKPADSALPMPSAPASSFTISDDPPSPPAPRPAAPTPTLSALPPPPGSKPSAAAPAPAPAPAPATANLIDLDTRASSDANITPVSPPAKLKEQLSDKAPTYYSVQLSTRQLGAPVRAPPPQYNMPIALPNPTATTSPKAPSAAPKGAANGNPFALTANGSNTAKFGWNSFENPLAAGDGDLSDAEQDVVIQPDQNKAPLPAAGGNPFTHVTVNPLATSTTNPLFASA